MVNVIGYPQYGKGFQDIGALYRSPGILQRGSGVGSIFSGLWKNLQPLVQTLGAESLKAGKNILREVASGNKSVRDALFEQGYQSIANLSEKGINRLKRMQNGSGLLTHTLARQLHPSRLSMMRKMSNNNSPCCTKKFKRRIQPTRKAKKSRKVGQKGGRVQRRRRGNRRNSRGTNRMKKMRKLRSLDIFNV